MVHVPLGHVAWLGCPATEIAATYSVVDLVTAQLMSVCDSPVVFKLLVQSQPAREMSELVERRYQTTAISAHPAAV